jgi:hypothetical protein
MGGELQLLMSDSRRTEELGSDTRSPVHGIIFANSGLGGLDSHVLDMFYSMND